MQFYPQGAAELCGVLFYYLYICTIFDCERDDALAFFIDEYSLLIRIYKILMKE